MDDDIGNVFITGGGGLETHQPEKGKLLSKRISDWLKVIQLMNDGTHILRVIFTAHAA